MLNTSKRCLKGSYLDIYLYLYACHRLTNECIKGVVCMNLCWVLRWKAAESLWNQMILMHAPWQKNGTLSQQSTLFKKTVLHKVSRQASIHYVLYVELEIGWCAFLLLCAEFDAIVTFFKNLGHSMLKHRYIKMYMKLLFTTF